MNFKPAIFFVFILNFYFGQKGFEIIAGNKVDIPFKLINNLIFIPLNVNGVELTFMLDSGVNETLLFSLDNKEVDFKNVEKIKFSGLGENIEIEGLKSEKNIITAGENMKDFSQTIFLILDENFNISSHIGIPVNGIIGYQFFKNNHIMINYLKKKITVYKTSDQLKNKFKKYAKIPITVENNKPYITADVEMTDEAVPSKMLLDLGNSDAVWLFPSLIPNFVYNRPNIDDYLGMGFNGDIYGKRSRIHSLTLGNFKMEKPLTAMPDEYSIQHINLVKDRKGSVGGDILRRFTVVFDYEGKMLYLKKNKNYGDPFHFNMSGLDIKHDGMQWQEDLVEVQPKQKVGAVNEINIDMNSSKFRYKFELKPTYSVAGCRKDSPAYLAGMQKGDKILKINGVQASELSLEKINEILRSEEGKVVSFLIERNNSEIKYSFELKDPIPYQNN